MMTINIPNIKHIIAISSGKGGVGKSTVAVNLAIALKTAKKKVGLLDADIYGPSIPKLLNITLSEPISRDKNKKMLPIVGYDMPTMSVGYLIDERSPAIWRGPMASMAVQQLLRDTEWGNLDYLIIDLPPGTGDIHLTLAQKLPLQGAVFITTPQSIALADVRKSITMFQKVEVPILGIIENMSIYQCPHCGEKDYLFGEKGAAQLSKEYNLPLLGSLPFDMQIRKQSDVGAPITHSEPDGLISQAYQHIAQQLISRLKKNSRTHFPKITIE